MSSTWVEVTPAYGRDYSNGKAMKADWDAGKDFILQDISSPWDGKPCSKRDMAGFGVIGRFNKNTKTVELQKSK